MFRRIAVRIGLLFAIAGLLAAQPTPLGGSAELSKALDRLNTLGGAKKLRQSADLSLSLEDRLARMRDMLGLAPSGSGVELKLEKLQSDLSLLSEKVDVLIGLQSGVAKKKPAARKKSSSVKKTKAKKKTRTAKKATSKKSVKRT